MNKKLIFGCLGAFLLLLIGGAIGLYVFVWKPVSTMAGGAIESVKGGVQQSIDSAKQLETLNQGLLNQGPFTPPADGLLNEDQVTRLAAVNESMVATLGVKLKTLEETYKRPQGSSTESQPSLSDLTQAVRGLGALTALIGDAKRAQVAALNANNLSLDEYRWLSKTAFTALAAGAALETTAGSKEALIALKKAGEEAQRAAGQVIGTDPTPSATPDPSVDTADLTQTAIRANYALIKPHQEAIRKGQIFGLLPL